MPRPRCLRRICCLPGVAYFKPAGIPLQLLEEVVVTLDEVEALRLADLEGLYQEEAAERMKISRPTFSRLIESAHKKVAEALVEGKALRLEGGPVQMKGGMIMPERDATSPAQAGRGLGMGPCGQGRRQGFGRRRGGRMGESPNGRWREGPERSSEDVTSGEDRVGSGEKRE